MNTNIVRINPPRRNPRAARDDHPEGVRLDMLTIRALSAAAADELIERGGVPPAHELRMKS